jgi:glycolate oxidase FAD binding subunit
VSGTELTNGNISELIELLGADKVRRDQSNGYEYSSPSDVVVLIESEQEVIKVVRWAQKAGVAIIPEGLGARAGYGNLINKKAITLSLSKYNRVIEHSVGDLTVTVQAGIKLTHLQEILGEKGQMLPLDPSWPEYSTAGGVVAAALTGPKRLKYGAPRDWVIGLRVVLANGQVIRTGGKVVKNVAGYDMNKLFIGSFGTLGVITECTFKLRPLPPSETAIILESSEANAISRLSRRILDSSLEPSALEMVNSLVLSRFVPDPATYGLIIGFEDEEKAVLKEQNLIVKWAKEEGLRIREILGNEQAARIWHSVGELMPHALDLENSNIVAIKAITLPNEVANTVQFIHCLAKDYGINAMVHGGTGTGITLAAINAKRDQWTEVKEFVGMVRRQIEEQFGYVVVQHAPSFFKAEFPVWGREPNGLFLMRMIKKQLDPEGLFNPGRFVGGI